MEIKVTCRGADLLPLDAIEEFQGNLKRRTKKDIELIIKSIEKYGFSFPFFVWNGTGHNYCLDGHGRIQALCEMRRRGVSLPLFPVVYVDAEDEAEAKQKLLRLNSQYGQMSIDSVMEFTDGLEVEFEDLALPSGTLKLYNKGETFKDNTVPSREEVESRTSLGDVYELSSGGAAHRLVCGDSTDPEVLKVVMGGTMADLLLTDPPYNVAYTGKTKDALNIKNDSIIAAEKLGRICYGVELDPHYCDIIVSRFIMWCRENGRQPLVTYNGRPYEEMKPMEPVKNHNAIRAGSMQGGS